MAINASDLLHAHRADHRLPPSVCDQVCRVATYTRDAEASKRISANRAPKIVVSSSGMATGGRVLHHLKAFAHDARNTVLLTGFQAAGTRGRALLQGSPELKIHGQWIHVGAEVESLSMLSAHADADELIRWLQGFGDGSGAGPRRVFVVHGEAQGSEALRSRINRTFGWASGEAGIDGLHPDECGRRSATEPGSPAVDGWSPRRMAAAAPGPLVESVADVGVEQAATHHVQRHWPVQGSRTPRRTRGVRQPGQWESPSPAGAMPAAGTLPAKPTRKSFGILGLHLVENGGAQDRPLELALHRGFEGQRQIADTPPAG